MQEVYLVKMMFRFFRLKILQISLKFAKKSFLCANTFSERAPVNWKESKIYFSCFCLCK